MYSEIHPVRFEGGIHNGTLDALSQFARHGLRIGGQDPSDFNTWDNLMTQYRDPNSQVEIGVEHPDEQTARDIATIARHTIWNGRNLWPGREIPPDRFNQGANHLRKAEGVPQEGAMQVAAAMVQVVPSSQEWKPAEQREPYEDCRNCNSPITTMNQEGHIYCPSCGWDEKHHGHVQSLASVDVRSDMSVTSKWTVVALGELQQPGGVGGANEYNPVTDGPNPEGPSFGDNAGNSPEQEVALETWVNMAVDLLNRGEQPDAILAQLAHDGCPDPQKVLQRAQQQPQAAPVSDEIGQDPFDAPPSPDAASTGEMQGLSQQPPVLASKRVRVAGTTTVGTEIDRWEGLWGEGMARIAIDGGGTLDVSTSVLEPMEGESFKHPVTDIQQFIDSIPQVEPTRPHIEARLANLELVRRAVRSTISKVSFSDQVKLQKFDSDAAAETALLQEILSNHHEDFEIAYAKAARKYEFNALKVATPDLTQWEGNPRVAGAIWATENFDVGVEADSYFTAAAAHYASNLGLTGAEFQEFLAGAEEHRIVRTEEFTANEPETADNDGPAEALFI